MIAVRRSDDRGRTKLPWLDSRHTFSFGHYYDRDHLGFGPLRVINDDRVAPGTGFGLHPHRDMEILTWVLKGQLEHRDSTGGRGVLAAGEWQRISAGTGVFHSEYNPSPTEPVHFLQIWLHPDQKGVRPEYEQRALPPGKGWRLAAGPDRRDGALTIHQDATVYVAELEPGEVAEYTPAAGRSAWVHVADGAAYLNGEVLEAGDGAAVRGEASVRLSATEPTKALLFDLA